MFDRIAFEQSPRRESTGVRLGPKAMLSPGAGASSIEEVLD